MKIREFQKKNWRRLFCIEIFHKIDATVARSSLVEFVALSIEYIVYLRIILKEKLVLFQILSKLCKFVN